MTAKCSSRVLSFSLAVMLSTGGGAVAGGLVDCNDPNAEHGAGATKACNSRCLGEAMACTATFFNLDGFADSLQLLEAFDTVDGSIRVPAAGNLPIIAVLGNAVCTNSGGVCNAATGANCAFPCLVCAAGTFDSHGGLTCPGLPGAGSVRVRQATHILTHTGDTPDEVSFNYTDNCDSGCANCPTTQLTTPAGSNTVVPDCTDDDPCTNDDCDLGVCANPSVCEDPNFCDDGDPCTSDTCVNDTDLGTECCTHEDICQCGDGNIDPGEFCDGASQAPGVTCTDTCDAQCTCCGDGVQQTGERCDGTDFEPSGSSQTGEGTCRSDCTYCGDGTVNGGEQCDDGNNVDTDSCKNDCTPPEGQDGCTPGFWKQPHHLQYWTGFDPDQLYDTVFGVTSTFEANTLLEVLWQGGGGEIALGRHAVAALLNSTHPDVDFAFTTQEVIDIVQEAYETGDFEGAKSLLAAENERGCTVVKNGGNQQPQGVSGRAQRQEKDGR